MLRLFLILLVSISFVYADDAYSLRIAGGKASLSDMNSILSGRNETHPDNLMTYGVDAGYRLVEGAFDVPLDIYVKGAFYYYPEKGTYTQKDPTKSTFGKVYRQDDVYEAIIYFKAVWNIDFWQNRLRLGAADGMSYVTDIPTVEKMEADYDNDNTSHILNYLELTVDFDLGRLVNYRPLHDLYAGFLLKHRSGAFGLINSVKEGGNNYNMLYLEKNF